MSNNPTDPRPQATGKHKAPYRKPVIQSESLTAVAVVCNGTLGGGRKGSTVIPPICSSTKLKS